MHAAFNLDQMEIDEKFLIMEQIWENLSANARVQGFTPKWHMDILADRERKVQDETATFQDISDLKKRLQKLANKNSTFRWS